MDNLISRVMILKYSNVQLSSKNHKAYKKKKKTQESMVHSKEKVNTFTETIPGEAQVLDLLDKSSKSTKLNKHTQNTPTMSDYIFFSSTFGTFSRIHNVLAHKMRLNKLKIKIIQAIFSDFNGMKLEIKNRM